MEYRICRVCKKEKLLCEFSFSHKKRRGTRCYVCSNIYNNLLRWSKPILVQPPIPDLGGEIWRPVVGFEDKFLISNLGRVKSLFYKKERLINGRLNSNGYFQISVIIGGVYKNKSIHRFVAEAFIPNPENKPQVNHKDGNKANNHVDNLEWNTQSENLQHAYDMGLSVCPDRRGESNAAAKLTAEDVILIRDKIKHKTERELAVEYKVHYISIRNIIRRKSWKHI